MNSDYYRREVLRHQQDLAKLQQEKSREGIKAADETKRANAAAAEAARSTIASTQSWKLRDAERYRTSALRHQQKVAELEGKIARSQEKLNDAQKRLSNAEEQEHRRRIYEQAQTARATERKFSAIAGRMAHHDHLHEVALSAIEKLSELPQTIVVLFLAANPLDQEQLRLDEEARAIGDMIRRSEYRDAVRLESRWAVRPLDVLQAINECNPRIVHFSGHGSDQDEIVFQDNQGRTKLVSKEAIVQTMAAGSDDIQLVFFNTCYSREQARAVVEHVPAAIGMNTSIGDDAARTFSAQFYSAIGFGRSVGRAFQQARAALMLEGIPEDCVPELFTTEGLLPDQLVLVQPSKEHTV